MALSSICSLFKGNRGTTSLQVAVAMTALATVAGVSAPAVERYLSYAQVLRATSEVRVIGSALHLLLFDLGVERALASPDSPHRLELLVGEGEVPQVSGKKTDGWTAPASSPTVASLNDCLITNAVGFCAKENPTRAFGWDGPYLKTRVHADPWGNRYAVNIGVLDRGRQYVAVVVSAGPDGIISVPYELRIEQVGQSFGDDIYFVLR